MMRDFQSMIDRKLQSEVRLLTDEQDYKFGVLLKELRDLKLQEETPRLGP